MSNKYIEHLKYLYRHKKYIMKYGLKMKMNFIQLLLHDWDKCLIPFQFMTYSNKFDDKGEYNKNLFNISQTLHYLLNRHHPQHWTKYNKSGAIKPKISQKYLREMILDWTAAEAAKGRISSYDDMFYHTRQWYKKDEKNIINMLDDKQIEYVKDFIGIFDEM